MTKKPAHSKNKEERRKEAEKLKAETERSLEVVRTKLAHAAIEEVERLRKASSILSLRERIKIHHQMVTAVIEVLDLPAHMHYSLGPEETQHVQEQMRTYESIRTDFKDVMGLGDEKLEQLFPKIRPFFENRAQAVAVLNDMAIQETQMMAYSLRV